MKKLTAILALALGSYIAQPAYAEIVCKKRVEMLADLGALYSEGVTGRGLSREGAMVEIVTSEQGTWTLIISSPNGTACIAGAGEAWQEVERVVNSGSDS